MKYFLAFLLLVSSCKIERPGVGDDGDPKVDHAVFTLTKDCAECHEPIRPNTATHPKSGDCGTCHKSSDTKGGWLPATGYTHPSNLTSCTSCHEKDRPDPPHDASGDCVACHTPSDDQEGWLPPTFFSHDPAPTSCTRCHESDRPNRDTHPKTGDCVSCHKYPNWKP